MGLHHALCDSSVVLIPSTASELFVSYGQCGATRQGKEQICKMLLQQHPLLVITMETESVSDNLPSLLSSAQTMHVPNGREHNPTQGPTDQLNLR